MRYSMKNMVFNLICFLLPERIVRMFFMCSIYRGLYRVNTMDTRLSSRVNSLLRICDDDHALGWGVKISAIFWNDETVLELKGVFDEQNQVKLTTESIQSLTNHILASVPNYLRYSTAEMRSDIEKVITQHNFLNTLTPA